MPPTLREMKRGRDYDGAGTAEDPYRFRTHISYFEGFQALCRTLGLDPGRRSSSHGADGGICDVVDAGSRVHVFKVDYGIGDGTPPLAWTLHAPDDQIVGDVTWYGDSALEINAGPQLSAILRRELDGSPKIAPALGVYFARLSLVSGGAVRAQAVPREKVRRVVENQEFIAATRADGDEREEEDPTARFRNNQWPDDLSPAWLLKATIAGTVVWDPTRRLPGLRSSPGFKAGGRQGGREVWVTISFREDDKRYLLAITSGASVAPKTIEQRNGLFSRCDLAKLHEHLSQSSDI